MHFIVLSTTLALQCISFFTTFRGTLTYFEGVHWTAPLLLTGAMQLLLYVLSNVAFSKRRPLTSRKVLAVGLCAISIFLSFVGISNSTIPPSEEYATEYNVFRQAYDPVLANVTAIAKGSDYKGRIGSIFGDVDATIIAANTRKTTLQADNTNQGAIPANTYQYTYDPVTRIQTGTTATANPNYPAAQAQIVSNNNEIANLDQALQGLTHDILMGYQATIQGLDLSSLETAADFSVALTAFEQIHLQEFEDYTNTVKIYKAVERALGNTPAERPDGLGELLKVASIHWDVDNLALQDFSDIEASATVAMNKRVTSRTGRAMNIYDLLLQGSEEPSYAEYVYRRVKEEIASKYAQIQDTLSRLGQTVTDPFQAEIDALDAAEADLTLHSPISLPAARFFERGKLSDFGNLFLMLFFAILVDGLTLLIPWATEKRRESVLFSRSSRDLMYEQEDILENLLLSCAPSSGMVASRDDEETFYQELLETISAFIKTFEPSPCTTPLGYPKRKAVDLGAMANDKYNDLTAFLLSMNYIQYVTVKEYKTLELDYLDPDWDGVAGLDGNDDEDTGYYLLKRQFVMWMNDNSLARFTRLWKGGNT